MKKLSLAIVVLCFFVCSVFADDTLNCNFGSCINTPDSANSQNNKIKQNNSYEKDPDTQNNTEDSYDENVYNQYGSDQSPAYLNREDTEPYQENNGAE